MPDDDIRKVPANIEAEQNVLGSCMLGSKVLSKINLDPSDFYRQEHRQLYQVLLDMDAAGMDLDAVTVGEHVESRGMANAVGGTSYLIELASLTWTVGNVRAYAKIVRDRAMLRRVVEVSSTLMQEAFQPNGRTAAEIVDGAVGELMKLGKVDTDCDFSLRQAVRMAWEDAQEAYANQGVLRGITTGFKRMDDRLGGFHAQDLIFLGARPGQGKTALAVNFMLAAARASHTVGLISGEQSARQIGQRGLAIDGGVRAEVLRNGQIEDSVWTLLSQSVSRLSQHRIRVYDRSAPTLEEVTRAARRWKQEYGLKALYVDYLQRIRFRGAEKRSEEVAEVAQGLKTLARDLDIPVICLAQVKAEVESRNDKRPRQGDIANTDEATREADLIAFLYRDEVYHDDTKRPGIAEINVEKNRHGATGQFLARFEAETMTFSDINPAELELDRAEHLEQPAAPRRARSVPVPKTGSRRSKSERETGAAAAADARIRDLTGGEVH